MNSKICCLKVLKKTWQAIVKMSLLALASADDSDSDFNNSEEMRAKWTRERLGRVRMCL